MKSIYPHGTTSLKRFSFFLLFLFFTHYAKSQTFTKEGTVYEDYNGNRGLNPLEPATNAGGNLSAYLLDDQNHRVLQSQVVGSNGTFSFSSLPSLPRGNYIVALGINNIPVGTKFGSSTNTYNSFLSMPAGWSFVNPGDRQWKQVGNNNNSTDNNFFIRKLPKSNNVQSEPICNPGSACTTIPGLSGTAAIGNAQYAIDKFKIVTLPSGGILKRGTTKIDVDDVITAAQAATLCFTTTTATGIVSFKYIAIDDAGDDYLSPDTAVYKIRLTLVDFRRDAPSSISLALNNQPNTLYAPFTTDTTGQTFIYSWTGPNGFTSTIKNPVLPANTAVENGLYIVKATNQYGCSSNDTLEARTMTSFQYCDAGNAYMIKGPGGTSNNILFRYNITSRGTTAVSSSLTSVDAVCYNVHNNLLYAWSEGNSTDKHMYAIDATGKQVDMGLSADADSFEEAYFAGTAGTDGRWYLSRGNSDGKGDDLKTIKVIDIDPKSPKYMQQVKSITANINVEPWDITWNASDSMIYGVFNAVLYQINPRTDSIKTFPTNAPDATYGSQFIDYQFNHYISVSGSGNIYRASLAGGVNADTVRFTLVSGGPGGFQYNDGAVNPAQPLDFGDAPLSYGHAYHRFNCVGGVGSEKLSLGSVVDYEGSSLNSNDAQGDDIDGYDDEDGVTTFPVLYPCNITTSYSVTLRTRNITGSAATLSGWIDFNGNGIFDTNERAQATIANGQTNVTLQWPTVNTGSLIPGSTTYARFRIARTAAEVDNPTGLATTEGEIEDYKIPVMGRDEGDAPAAKYGSPVSFVYGDDNNDNVPDNPAALWLGTLSSANDGSSPCSTISNTDANGDDNDGIDDEDGFVPTGYFAPGVPTNISFVVNGNTHGQTGFYGVWIDWGGNGFENTVNKEFYSGTFRVGSPVVITIPVTAPAGTTSPDVYFRFRVSPFAFSFSNFDDTLVNSETEDYYYHNIVTNALPVTFTSFTASEHGDDVLLQWQTATENNNSGFEIQHSTNGSSWDVINFVNGSGNSNALQHYNYTHLNPGKGLHYYRIRQIDDDGHSTLTAIRIINIKGDPVIQVYPNPAKDKLFITSTFGKNIQELRIFNASAQQVLQRTNILNGSSINVSNLSPGLYVMRIVFENEYPVFRKILIE